MDENPAVCSVHGCGRPVRARTWCQRHYARWLRTGTLEARTWTRQGECTVEGCDQPAWSGGLCEMHRWRVRVHGEPGAPAKIKRRRAKERLPCSVDGCERLRKGKLYCRLHTERLRRTGDVGVPQPLFVKGRVKPRKDGYIRLTMPDGRRVLEHIYVMEQALGRRLVPPENVHHKNGVGHDNDPGNLELWLKMQPSGQRVTDLMEYIAKYHADAMRALLAEKG